MKKIFLISIGLFALILFSNCSHPKASKINELLGSFVEVKGDTFKMGDNFFPDAGEVKVVLSNFSIQSSEVTQELYSFVMDTNPSYRKTDKNLPVTDVSWDDCQTFIGRINMITGKKYRLPTEAEWEFAAKGGIESKGYKFSGADSLNLVGWFYENSSTTNPVKQKKPNELGIYDMTGNVWEWVQDNFEVRVPSETLLTNPKGASSAQNGKVCKGCCFTNIPKDCNPAFRFGGNPSSRDQHIGFRLVLESSK